MKTLNFHHGFLTILFAAITFIVQAQTLVDAYLTTTSPVNGLVEGTMFITLADTAQVEQVEIKLGSNTSDSDSKKLIKLK